MQEVSKAQGLTLASELATIEGQMAFLEDQASELREALLANLQHQGVTFVRLEDGTTYRRSHRDTLKVKDEAKAEAWADEHGCWKLDTGKAMKILRRELKLPRFFERVKGKEYLTLVRGTEEEE